MRLRFDRRLSRLLAGIVVALLAVGAFLTRGPIGLGNGPLSFESFSGLGWHDLHQVPAGLVFPVINHGRAPAVINGITLVGGGSGYPAPRLITVYGAHNKGCSTIGPLTARGGTADAGPCSIGRLDLAGLVIPPSRKVLDSVSGNLVAVPALGFVAEVTPPAPQGCWTVKAMAIHYRVGIRHYTATVPEAGAVCGRGVSSAGMQAAMSALG
jgi:hypothetical protein